MKRKSKLGISSSPEQFDSAIKEKERLAEEKLAKRLSRDSAEQEEIERENKLLNPKNNTEDSMFKAPTQKGNDPKHVLFFRPELDAIKDEEDDAPKPGPSFTPSFDSIIE